MTVIAEYDAAASALAIGRAVPDGLRVELERVVPRSRAAVGYFWVHGSPVDGFRRALADQRVVDEVDFLDGLDDTDRGERRLYRGRYRLESEAVLSAMLDHDGHVLEAAGDGDDWELLLRFPDAERFEEFHRTVVRDRGLPLAVDQRYVAGRPAGGDAKLTPRQYETLVTAHERGYFEIPRRITLVDLADDLGVSDQAVSERLRRGEAKLVRSHLLDGDD